MNTKTKFTGLIIILIITLASLVGVTFSWILIQNSLNADNLLVITESKNITLTVEVKCNNEAYKTVETKNEYIAMFYNAKPSDNFAFRLSIKNVGNIAATTSLSFVNITNMYVDDSYYDITVDENGINVKTLKDDVPNLLEWYNIDEVKLTRTATTSTVLDKPLSELIDANNNWYLYNSQVINVNETLIVEFNMSYDENSTIQGININVDSIYVNVS